MPSKGERIIGEYKMISEQSVKVSIITVVFNGGNTIEQTINSVRTQNYENIEYIIIDGDSTDNTREIIQRYRNDIDIFISEKDEGLYYAMNKGLILASGEIIGIINSDDLYAEEAVSKIVEYYNKNNPDVIFGDAIWFDHSEKTSLYTCQDIEELWCRMAIPHPTVFIKKEIYKEYGLFNTSYKIAADYDLILRLYSEGIRFGYINETLAYFRRGGMSAQKQDQCIREAMEISLSYIHKCKKKKKWLPKIYEQYIIGKFVQLMEEKSEILLQSLRQILFKTAKENHVVIFGAGIYGERCVEILAETDIEIDFFVDNDSLKWGKDLAGKVIKAPDELYGYKGCILVAALKYEKDIRQQLDGIDTQLKSISLLDWAKNAVYIWEKCFLIQQRGKNE